MPLLLDGVFKEKRELVKELKKLGVKSVAVKEIFIANGKTLVFLKGDADEELSQEAEEIVKVHTYVEKLKGLIELEREAQMKAQEEEIKRLSGKERELLGRAILDLKGVRAGSKYNLYLVRFWREKPIETQIGSGDVVLVSRGNPLKSDLLGTVLKVSEKTITVAFENSPPRWVYKRGVRIDLYVNDITFKRMEENLEELRNAEGRRREIRNVIIGLKKPEGAKKIPFTPINEKLNERQKEAVSLALGAKDFFLVHGPPGTGKTSTVAELIAQLVKEGRKVLATADSNVAADNILLKLKENYQNIRAVRVGHPARVLEEIEEFSIFALFEKRKESEKIKSGWEKVRELIEKRDKFTKPIPSLRRGMSDEEIIYFGRRNKSFRGVPKKLMASMANWLLVNYEIDVRIKALKEMEEEVLRKIVSEADVVVSTNSMVKGELLDSFTFDDAVIDEGSQQVEPSTLIPIMKAERFFIAGDHKQLPPTVVSEEARELEKTLFEKLIEREPNLSLMLTVQYRMNEKIMEFPSREFYDGKLVAAPEVKSITLSDFSLSEPQKFKRVLSPDVPLGFLDTSQVNAYEFQPQGSTSYENYEEAVLSVKLVKTLLNMGAKREWIGIITPYAAQVKLIKELLLESGIKVEVNSVDGFQGREKEIIIISFVRSNEEGEIGFLKDLRRLNVSITRAKRKLVGIGNSETLKSNETYARFLSHIKREGAVEKLS